MNKVIITDIILDYIKAKNKHITYFEKIPKLNSIWNVSKIVSYPNVCRGQKVVELTNNSSDFLRLPLNIVHILKTEDIKTL